MAHDTGQSRPDLATLQDRATETEFFELLRQLETGDLRFGRSGGPDREPARLGQGARLSFATGDVEALQIDAETGKARLDVHVLGLLGPEGPMPLHITRWVINRLSNRWFRGDAEGATSDRAFLNFCNLLQHRLIALYWRSWADARMEIQHEHGTGGRVGAMFRALAGIALPGVPEDAVTRDHKLRHGTSLISETHGVERLTGYLSDIAGAAVSVREFVAHWLEIPRNLQTRLGGQFAELGRSATVGSRVFSRQDRAEIRVGPVPLARFMEFVSDGRALNQLRDAILFAVGLQTEYDLRLVLKAGDIPEARLGHGQLGRTMWLSPDQSKDADDLCFTRLNTRHLKDQMGVATA